MTRPKIAPNRNVMNLLIFLFQRQSRRRRKIFLRLLDKLFIARSAQASELLAATARSSSFGVVFSVLWAIFFSVILASVWGIANVPELAAVSAVVGFFGGLMWLIASLVFLKSAPKDFFAANELPNAKVNNLYETNQRVLPPQQSQSAQSYVPPADSWKAPNTGEFARPHSITEGTTKLLKKDEE